jgi:alkanesulfonate monooxygenase SsuD/methylene tetrahydromethanopterin reductase-like flavin-dependent oxidoreductase (luciferase family)
VKVGQFFLIPNEGHAVSAAERYKRVLDMAEYANGKGYEAVWITEHHFSDHGYSANPLMLLSQVGHVAPDLRLGTGIVVLPLWHPLRLAEDIAILDVLTGGRVDVGIGRGYQPHEFTGLGVDVADSREQFNEAMEILLGAWTKEDFAYDGKFWKFPALTVLPRPLQQPHPPIWMAATSPPSIRAAVENGYHLCTGTGAVPEEILQRNAYVDTLMEDLGMPANSIEHAASRVICCTTDESEIEHAIEASRWQIRASRQMIQGTVPVGGRIKAPPFAGEPDNETWKRRMIIGGPEECIRKVQELADVGITYIWGMFEFGDLPHETAMRSLKLFTEEVLPHVRGIETKHIDRANRDATLEQFMSGGSKLQPGL